MVLVCLVVLVVVSSLHGAPQFPGGLSFNLPVSPCLSSDADVFFFLNIWALVSPLKHRKQKNVLFLFPCN